MNYTFTNKNGKEQTVDIPEAYIHQQQASLGIGMMEACKLYLSDEGYVENAAIDELTAKATGKPKRKRKEDPTKRAIISELYGLLANGDFRIEEDAAAAVRPGPARGRAAMRSRRRAGADPRYARPVRQGNSSAPGRRN